MNRWKLAAACATALALAACSATPTWNTGSFPQQPEYGMVTAQASAEVGE